MNCPKCCPCLVAEVGTGSVLYLPQHGGTDASDSPCPDRNPSPPPELEAHRDLLNEESIGNTAFSKHWLFSTLMKLIEEVDKENEENEDQEGTNTDLVVDVDDELQNELCKLWDMSMNQEVARFLNEFRAVEILTGIIQKSKAPRVTEICVGILGNMACEASVCEEMTKNAKFIEMTITMLENRDTPTLVENTRLIYTCLSNSGTRGMLINAIQRSEEVLNHLRFIFNSSTNCDLLKNTAELVDILLDLESDLCVSWATIDFVHSLLEATEQIGSSNSEAMAVYLHIFQSLSTTEMGVEALVCNSERLERKVLKYLDLLCEYEIVSVDKFEGPLSSALSVFNILLTSRPLDQVAHLWKDEKLMRILLKILEPLYPMIQKYREAGKGTDPDTSSITGGPQAVTAGHQEGAGQGGEDLKAGDDATEVDKEELRQLSMLYEVLSGLILDFCDIVFMQSSSTKATLQNEPQNQGSEGDVTTGEGESYKGQRDLPSQTVTPDTDIKDSENKTDCQEPGACPQEKGDNQSGQSDVEPPVSCEAILEYLDDSCSRCRINYFALCVKEASNGAALCDQIYDLAESFKKERLCRILNDIAAGKIVSRADSSKCNEDSNM